MNAQRRKGKGGFGQKKTIIEVNAANVERLIQILTELTNENHDIHLYGSMTSRNSTPNRIARRFKCAPNKAFENTLHRLLKLARSNHADFGFFIDQLTPPINVVQRQEIEHQIAGMLTQNSKSM